MSTETVKVCNHIDIGNGRHCNKVFRITASPTERGSYGAHIRTHNANDVIYKLAAGPKYREEHPNAVMVKKWISEH